MLSRDRVIWLHNHPLPPSKSSTGITHGNLRKRDNLLPEEEGGMGLGEEPNHATARKPGLLYIIQYSLAFVIDLKTHFHPRLIIAIYFLFW
jgi:hypothetical protein